MQARARDERWMREALRLARKGSGWTDPNPMVGAVIVKNGRIIARGFHHRVGGAHAEIEALRAARGSVRGATLYVNLEPCSHFGRTPPCADAIVRAGIARVVCATRDPNPLVAGRGITRLRRAGTRVSIGLLAPEARTLNAAFFIFHRERRPLVSLKFAVSLDGALATRTGDSKWITNGHARAFARAIRGEHQAVLVGVRTVISDDPHLGARMSSARDPLRIVLDPHLRIPLSARMLRDANVLVVGLSGASLRARKRLEERGVAVALLPGKTIAPKQLFAELRRREIVSVLVEGGGDTIGRFLDSRIVDRVYALYGPMLIGGIHAVRVGGKGATKVRNALRLKNVSTKQFGDTTLLRGTVIR